MPTSDSFPCAYLDWIHLECTKWNLIFYILHSRGKRHTYFWKVWKDSIRVLLIGFRFSKQLFKIVSFVSFQEWQKLPWVALDAFHFHLFWPLYNFCLNFYHEPLMFYLSRKKKTTKFAVCYNRFVILLKIADSYRNSGSQNTTWQSTQAPLALWRLLRHRGCTPAWGFHAQASCALPPPRPQRAPPALVAAQMSAFPPRLSLLIPSKPITPQHQSSWL